MDFYHSQYGVKVRYAVDTFVVWWPKDYYGTSIPCCVPGSADHDGEDFSQALLMIVTPPNLLGQWKKLQPEEISHEEAKVQLTMSGHES